MGNVVNQAAAEEAVARLPEAQRLLQAIVKAMNDYGDFLLHHDLMVVEDPDGDVRLVSTALVATVDFTDGNNTCTIVLKDGPIDRTTHLVGQSLHSYLVARRMEEAAFLLESTNDSVLRVGYVDVEGIVGKRMLGWREVYSG
jgi:hypothetical protein